MGILDLIFPKRCVGCNKLGEYICANCFTSISFDVDRICLVCNRQAVDSITHPVCRSRYVIDGITASVAYKGIIKKLIYAFKYKPFLSDLEKILTDLFYEGLIQNEQFNKVIYSDSIFIPIPLYPQRFRERGYNQSEILAKNLSIQFKIPNLSVLSRIRQTETQTKLKREERRDNIKGVFIISNKKAIEYINTRNIQVILVDDVITSGATMLEAANVMKRAGVKKVWGIALAHGT